MSRDRRRGDHDGGSLAAGARRGAGDRSAGGAREGLGRLLPVALAASAIAAAWLAYARSGGELGGTARAAREAVADRKGAEARGLVDRWAALDPGGGEPAYYRALLEVQADRPAEALDAIGKALALGHPEGPLQVLRAVLLARAGRLDQAEPILAKAFEAAAEPRAEVAEALSRVYLKTYRLTQALPVLRSWMEAAPDDPRPYLRRCEVAERTGSGPEAQVGDYREALRRDPGLLGARLGLAEKLREACLYDQAEAEYEALLGRDPGNVRGAVGAGRVALIKGDVEGACRHFRSALALDPKDGAALRELGLIELNGGRFAEARALLKSAVEVDPHDPEIRYSYVMALRGAGEMGRAAEEAVVADRLKEARRRIADLREGLTERPDDVDLRAEAARWLIEHGHEKEGLEWTEAILRKRPGHPPTCQLLADYHAKRGEFGLANYYRTSSLSKAAGR